MKKLILFITLFLSYPLFVSAEDSRFIDFTKVLNNSKPGSQAQQKLQQRFQQETKKFKKTEDDLRKEESELISKKKELKPEEYQKKVQALRKKVANLQKNKQTSFNNIAKSRNDAKQALLKAVNPIVKKYMEENKIRIVFDKQGIIMADVELEITDKIISILNKELPSLKID